MFYDSYMTYVTDNELTEFLENKKGEKGKAWVEKCRNLLYKFFTGKGDQVKGNGRCSVL
jgi:hypothetical protein